MGNENSLILPRNEIKNCCVMYQNEEDTSKVCKTTIFQGSCRRGCLNSLFYNMAHALGSFSNDKENVIRNRQFRSCDFLPSASLLKYATSGQMCAPLN